MKKRKEDKIIGIMHIKTDQTETSLERVAENEDIHNLLDVQSPQVMKKSA
jgi:hypothetical protein